MTGMTPNYKNCLERGNAYQEFVADVLEKELSIMLDIYTTKHEQYNIGENKQGIEIKFDDLYKKTGNLYIEIEEKSNPQNQNFVPSGIFRNDNSWLYLIGDYDEIFIFAKTDLKRLQKEGAYRNTGNTTSRAFLLRKADAEKYCAKKINLAKDKFDDQDIW